MQRFSTPEEVFGPVSIKELKNDNYTRITDNYLPTADIAFLDEIWKSSPAILNTLLTIINERRFKNGRYLEEVPLKAIIAASNEFPTPNSGLEALYDRFIVRLCVYPTKNKDNFHKVVSNNKVSSFVEVSQPLSNSEWEMLIELANGVDVPDDVFAFLDQIRDAVNEYNKAENVQPIYISDRRWQKAIFIVKTASMLSGRSQIAPMDLYVLKHCLWSSLEDQVVINDIIDSVLSSYNPYTSSRLSAWIKEYRQIVDETESLFSKYGKRDTFKIEGKDCYKVNVGSNGFLSSKKTYYIPVDQVSECKHYLAMSDSNNSVQYFVKTNDGSRVEIVIDGQNKNFPLFKGPGITDPNLLRPYRINLENKINELDRMIQSTESDIVSLKNGKGSPFVEYKCNDQALSNMQNDLLKMKDKRVDAVKYLDKIKSNEY